MKPLVLALLCTLPLLGQSNTGELHLVVTDPTGLGVKSTVELVSDANDYRQVLSTDNEGNLNVKRLPFGTYRIAVRSDGFLPLAQPVQVRSAVPEKIALKLSLPGVSTIVEVHEQELLVDPARIGALNRVGTQALATREASLPGRSLADLVNSQPGWLYEGNAVLHPRGSEYQTQFVVDGVPLTNKGSLGFAPEIEADDVQSMAIYTANIPAEYGRKMGGVVEVNTQKDSRQGLHGTLAALGGSFATAAGYGLLQYGWGKNTLSISSNAAVTDRYLNPPVIQNYTNTATTGTLAGHYEHDLARDHLGLSVRRNQVRFLVPNELVQQAAGQRQHRANVETLGIVWYQHTVSPKAVAELRGMVRDNTDTLNSNPLSTPIIAAQDRGFREAYTKASISVHHGRHEWKAGTEVDFTSIHEDFNYAIADPEQFDPRTPSAFNFRGRAFDREQAAFVQDLARWGNWTLSAGLRWDHYQLLIRQSAFSPRLGVGRFFSGLDLLLHASYDQVFQTPASENILLSSSPEITAVNPSVLRLPVQPTHGNYYQMGATKGVGGKIRLEVNYFRRSFDNYADDDQLLNSSISFPTAFRSATIYGAEAKLDIPRWGRVSGFISYSYLVGSASLPVVGGLFLGDDAANALKQNHGRFWITQDQRNTLRTRFHYHLSPRFWLAAGASYDSGLPTEFVGSIDDATAQYGQQILQRVNLVRGRLRPSFAVNVSSGVELHRTDKLTVRIQADVSNLTNRLNLTNFAGLFSGTALAPPRTCFLRLETKF